MGLRLAKASLPVNGHCLRAQACLEKIQSVLSPKEFAVEQVGRRAEHSSCQRLVGIALVEPSDARIVSSLPQACDVLSAFLCHLVESFRVRISRPRPKRRAARRGRASGISANLFGRDQMRGFLGCRK